MHGHNTTGSELGKNGEFGHICVFEKNGFEVSTSTRGMDSGVRVDVWGLGGDRVCQEWVSGGEGVEGVSRTSPG